MARTPTTPHNEVVRLVPAGLPYNRSSSSSKDQLFVNCFPETITNPVSSAKKTYCVKRSGLTSYTTISGASGEARGVFYWEGKLFAVFGNKVYRDGTALTPTLTTSTGKVGFTEVSYGLKKYLFYCDGTRGYFIDAVAPTSVTTVGNGEVIDAVVTAGGTGYTNGTYTSVPFTGGGGSGALATVIVSANAISEINITTKGSGYTSSPTLDFTGIAGLLAGSSYGASIVLTSFPSPHVPTPVFLDGYVVLGKANTSDVYSSALGEYDYWGSSDVVVVNQYPGDIIGLAKQNNQIVVLKEDSIEFLWDAGNATGSPFNRTTQAVTQYGCAAVGTIDEHEERVVFVGITQTGTVGVWSISGFKETKVSTEAIDRILASETSISNSTAMAIRSQGHYFYVLRIPSGRTLVYDIEEKYWHEWTSTVSGVEGNFVGKWSTAIGTDPIIQYESGNVIYKMSPTVYNDVTGVIKTKYQSIITDIENEKRKRWNGVWFIGDRQTSSSPMVISYSDDDYQTWSGNFTVDISERAYVKNLGTSRRRAWKLEHEANTPFRFEALEISYTQGSH